MEVRAAGPRWAVEFKEGAHTFLTAMGLEIGQKTGPGAIAGYLVVKLPADVDPATTNRGVFLGRVRVPERRVTWLKGDEFAAGALLPAQHLIAITPNAGFEPGLWAVKVRDTVMDRNGRPINPTNATWTVEIGEPRLRPDDSGPARNTLKLKFTTEVDPATYADGIVVEKRVADGWEEEPRGSATIAPSAHGGSVKEVGLQPLGGWERGATYRVRVTEAIRDERRQPLTNAEDFSFVVPKSGPFETRHEPRRPTAQASAQAASTGPAFPGGQAMGWHGHWTDPVTGLIYMRHRWYDPRTGTFLSPDPMQDIDSPNQYLFGAGRPHEVVDPLGLCVAWGCQQQFRFAFQDPTLTEEVRQVQAAATKANAAMGAVARRTVQTTAVAAGATVAIGAAPVASILAGGGVLLGGQSFLERYDVRRTQQLAEGRGTRSEALGLAVADTTGLSGLAEGVLEFRIGSGQGMSKAEAGEALGGGGFDLGLSALGSVGAARPAGTSASYSGNLAADVYRGIRLNFIVRRAAHDVDAAIASGSAESLLSLGSSLGRARQALGGGALGSAARGTLVDALSKTCQASLISDPLQSVKAPPLHEPFFPGLFGLDRINKPSSRAVETVGIAERFPSRLRAASVSTAFPHASFS